MHYKRVRHHGHQGLSRVDNRKAHPLYAVWRHATRSKVGIIDSWRDFWVFVGAVGERPSDRHRFLPLNKKMPFGPDNFEWRPPFFEEPGKFVRPGGQAEFLRTYRRRPESKEAEKSRLLRVYNLTDTDYAAMLVAQGGVCACCKQPQRPIRKKDGSMVLQLSVDHDHDTGEVRGLLCMQCNRGIGMLGDRIERLQMALEYLIRAEERSVARLSDQQKRA